MTNPGCTVDDSEVQTLVGVQRSVLLLLDETVHGEISRIIVVRISFCALHEWSRSHRNLLYIKKVIVDEVKIWTGHEN